jgi:hypothetical protein
VVPVYGSHFLHTDSPGTAAGEIAGFLGSGWEAGDKG